MRKEKEIPANIVTFFEAVKRAEGGALPAGFAVTEKRRPEGEWQAAGGSWKRLHPGNLWTFHGFTTDNGGRSWSGEGDDATSSEGINASPHSDRPPCTGSKALVPVIRLRQARANQAGDGALRRTKPRPGGCPILQNV